MERENRGRNFRERKIQEREIGKILLKERENRKEREIYQNLHANSGSTFKNLRYSNHAKQINHQGFNQAIIKGGHQLQKTKREVETKEKRYADWEAKFFFIFSFPELVDNKLLHRVGNNEDRAISLALSQIHKGSLEGCTTHDKLSYKAEQKKEE